MHYIDLDIAYENETLWQACERLAGEDSSVAWKVVNESGPGGGWPVVRFSANDAQTLWSVVYAYEGNDAIAASERMDDYAEYEVS